MAGLDHGILNLPLSKRGNIDAQIDAWKRQEAKAWKDASRKAHHERRAASAALKAAPDEWLSGLAARQNRTIKQTRAKLRSVCVSRPSLILRFLSEAAAK